MREPMAVYVAHRVLSNVIQRVNFFWKNSGSSASAPYCMVFGASVAQNSSQNVTEILKHQ